MAAALPCDGKGSGRQGGGDRRLYLVPTRAPPLSFSNYDDGRWQSRQQAPHGGTLTERRRRRHWQLVAAAAAVVE